MNNQSRLGDLITIQRGTTYKSALLGQPGPVLLGLASIARNGGFRPDNLKTYGGESAESLLVRQGELYASLKDVTQSADLLGSVARLPLVGPVGRLTQDTVRLDIFSTEVDAEFLYWSLLTPEYRAYCRAHSTGTTTLGLPRDDFLGYEVWLPPIDEQRRIAGVLDALDDLIDTNERLTARCAALRLALTEKALEGASDSKPLSSLATFINGKNFTKGAVGTGRPVIRTPEVRVGPSASTVRSDIEADDDFVASRGDILFVWSGSLLLGRWLFETGLINQHIFKVKPSPGVPDWLVYGLIEHQMPWFLGLAADKATTMGHIQRRHLDEPVPVPDAATVRVLDNTIRPLWEAEIELAEESQQLRRTRDELLPLLMSGKVRVLSNEPAKQDAQAGAA